MKNERGIILTYLSLFSSSSTLICCALPSLFVLLGAGAVFASLIEIFPFLITISEYKLVLFVFAFLMLIFTGIFQRYSDQLSCPTDPILAKKCKQTRVWSKYIYVFSWICFLIGITVTFVIPNLI